MAVKPLVERKDFDSRDFFTDVEFYVNGKLIPFDGCTAFGDVGHVLSGVCRKVNGFEDWIREYMNNLDISDVDSWDTDELCYWFAYEMDQDFNDSYDDGFYLDGSGIVYDDHGVRVEAFEKEGVDEAVVKRIKGNKTVKEAKIAVNGRPRALSPQYDSRKSFYNKAHVVDDNDGNSTLYSYNTPVCRIVGDKVELLPKWDYSATTLRHVKDFLQQNGFEAGSKAQIAKRYSTVEESKRRSSKRGVNEDYDDPSWEDIAEDPYMGYEGLDDVKRALETAANDADDIRYYLANAWKAFDNDYNSAIEMFSGPDDAYAAAEALNKIKGLLAQAYKLIPDEVVNLANDSYGMYD